MTGLFTRCVPTRNREKMSYVCRLRLIRIAQFLCAVISLGIFSRRYSNVYHLVNIIKTRRGVNSSYVAVEAILAAAAFYTLLLMVLLCWKYSSSPGNKRWRRVWQLLDMFFAGAFTAVAVLTQPNGGLAGPNTCYLPPDFEVGPIVEQIATPRDRTCGLTWATFVLAILSIIFHVITASLHEIPSRRRTHVDDYMMGDLEDTPPRPVGAHSRDPEGPHTPRHSPTHGATSRPSTADTLNPAADYGPHATYSPLATRDPRGGYDPVPLG
ncbi:hypothetical protein M011DRAFT_417236, partial [Sporormia fimetaria CBS 119925]